MTTTLASAVVIGDYLRWMRTRNLSPETLRASHSTLHGLSRHTRTCLTDLAPAHLLDWQAHRATVVAPSTLRTQTSCVRAFYRWALLEERITIDPTLRMQTPKVAAMLPRPIDEHLLVQALEAGDDRMRAILGLAAFAGLRAHEVAGLAWRNVWLDTTEPYLRIVGKGSKEGLVDLSPALVDILAALPARRGPVITKANGTGRVTANGLSSAANRHLRACGIDDTFHALRHRFVTVVCRIGGIRTAQEAARHASPTTTAGYARVARRDSRPVVVAAGEIQSA